MRPFRPLIAALLIAGPAAAQDVIGFDIGSFGKVVLSRNQVAGEPIPEAAFGAYNNEFMSTYSPRSIFATMGRSVGRLDVATDNGVFPCTAFLVDDNLIMTNNHCVPGITENARAGATTIVGVHFVMGYVQEGVTEGTETFIVDPTPVETSKPLDYTLLRIVDAKPGRDVGALRLAAVTPNDNDPYWIIGHPMGEAQRISREKCRANAPALSDGQLLHTCDTKPGNSGSPVIDASTQQVIGLHHAGSANNSVNYAVPMSSILAASAVLATLSPTAPAPPPQPTPEATALGRLSEALAIPDAATRLTALEALVEDAAGTSAARTAGQLIAALRPPHAPAPATGPSDSLADRMAADADVQECDRSAGDSFHPDRAKGLMLQEGVRFEDIDPDRGLAACLRALESFPDHPRMTAFLGEALAAAERYEEALAAYRSAARAGDAIGQAGYGIAHLHGYGIEVSHDTALEWLTRSADQGYPIAQTGLAVMYQRGLGVEQSAQTALDLYTRAARQGYHGAQNQLADAYMAGDMVEASAVTAAFWYEKAAEQGNADAQYNLGNLLATGQGVAQSDETAATWYGKAAAQGHAAAQVALASFLFQGRGVAQSDQRAAEWFGTAAAQENAVALISLGWMYETGRGVTRDAPQAAGHYLRALQAGSDWPILRSAQDWSPDTALAMQRALSKQSVYTGPITGQIGANTQDAMRSLLP
jgi:TPR repeat protein/V8-like Glu-specific endopeptidase